MQYWPLSKRYLNVNNVTVTQLGQYVLFFSVKIYLTLYMFVAMRLVSVADPEDGARGRRREPVGCAPSWGAGGRVPAGGLGQSWSINAFCAMVKPFS